MCWVVCMVGDIYCIFCCSGIFMYLYDFKDLKKVGCLCLMYEVNFMSMLIE